MTDKNESLNQGNIVIFQTGNGDTKIDVRFADGRVWLTQAQLVETVWKSHTEL